MFVAKEEAFPSRMCFVSILPQGSVPRVLTLVQRIPLTITQSATRIKVCALSPNLSSREKCLLSAKSKAKKAKKF
jgi:hypothetical protein